MSSCQISGVWHPGPQSKTVFIRPSNICIHLTSIWTSISPSICPSNSFFSWSLTHLHCWSLSSLWAPAALIHSFLPLHKLMRTFVCLPRSSPFPPLVLFFLLEVFIPLLCLFSVQHSFSSQHLSLHSLLFSSSFLFNLISLSFSFTHFFPLLHLPLSSLFSLCSTCFLLPSFYLLSSGSATLSLYASSPTCISLFRSLYPVLSCSIAMHSLLSVSLSPFSLPSSSSSSSNSRRAKKRGMKRRIAQ